MKLRTLFLFGYSLFIALVIPSISYWAASGIQSNFDSQFEKQAKKEGIELPEGFSITQVCGDYSFVSKMPPLRPICVELEQINTLEYWSVVVGLVGLGVLLSVWLAGLIARGSRTLLVLIFKPGLTLTQLAIAFLVLGHGLLLVASIYYLESFWLNRVHFVLIGGASLITFISSIKILASLFSNFRRAEAKVFGISIARKDAPKLWELVDEVSTDAKTEGPRNLVIGMSPSFFVTEANVRTIDGVFKGRTLYLSVPFCRLLSIQELKAIIGHELGHFVGLDTKFSRHFYPIYRGAQESLSILHNHGEGEGGLHSIAILPATFMMSFFMNTFQQIETRIGRERELEADGLAGKICGKSTIASALIKVHAFANLWPYVEKKMVESMSEGRQLVNASIFFEHIATNLPIDYISQGLGDSHTEHPTDSHPSLNSRLKALGFSLNDQMLSQITAKSEVSANSIIDGIDEIEQALTDIEHRKLSHAHGINIPKREDVAFDLILLRSMISLILADGSISEDELISIKNIYRALIENELSDESLKMEIEATKAWKEGLLDYLQRAELRLNPEGKALVLKALLLTAVADGEFHEKEKELIGNVAQVLKVDGEKFSTIVKETFEKAP
jgi:Zn-dependent protease with chaperone function/uncharacterized tellurite resistance protein B-like protein